MGPSGPEILGKEGIQIVCWKVPHVTALTLCKGITLPDPAQGWAQEATLCLGTHKDLDVVL